MRSGKDRRKIPDNSTPSFEDIAPAAPERRKQRDRRIENLDVDERQTLLSEMPSIDNSGPDRKD